MNAYLKAARGLTMAAAALTILAQYLHGTTARDWAAGAILAVSSGLLMAAFYAMGQSGGIARGLELNKRERAELVDTLNEASLTIQTANRVLRVAFHELERRGIAAPPDPNTLT